MSRSNCWTRGTLTGAAVVPILTVALLESFSYSRRSQIKLIVVLPNRYPAPSVIPLSSDELTAAVPPTPALVVRLERPNQSMCSSYPAARYKGPLVYVTPADHV